MFSQGGRLEEALEQYKRSKEYGVERATMHIRNVRASNIGGIQILTLRLMIQVSAKILGKKMAEVEATQRTKP